MDEWAKMLITVVCSVVASGGFWSYLQARREKKDAKTKLLLGLAHDRIMSLAALYTSRGYITQDEYENFHDYLYVPYHDSNGNGTGTKAMAEVERLPMHEHPLNKKEV